jgi:hypothetical protein
VKLVQASIARHRTLEEVVKAKPIAKYDDMGKAFVKPDQFVEAIYKELTAKPAPPVPRPAPPAH